MRNVLCLISLLIPVLLYGQERLYYDAGWQPTKKGRAKYYRIIEKQDSLYKVSDYTKKGKPYRIGYRTNIESNNYRYRTGAYTWFDVTGNKIREGAFANGVRIGEWREFYSGGIVRAELTYDVNGEMMHSVYYDSLPHNIVSLMDHQGNIEKEWLYNEDSVYSETRYEDDAKVRRSYTHTVSYKSGKTKSKLVVKKGETQMSECYDEMGRVKKCDTVSTMRMKYVEQMPSSTFSMPKFLQQNLKYPDNERQANIEGRVVIRFCVDEDGTISDAVPSEGTVPAFLDEAVRVVDEMPAWNPGIQNGRPVRVYFNLPLTFKLQ